MLRTIMMIVGLLPAAVMSAEPIVLVISDADLIAKLLPESGLIEQQSTVVDERLRDWVEQHYHFRPEPQQLNIWLTRQPGSARILGGMIKAQVVYQQQTITLAIGMSQELRVSRAAVAAVPTSLLPVLQSSIGIGYLNRYTMISARQLGYLADVMQKEGQPAALVADALFRNGVLLASVIQTTD